MRGNSRTDQTAGDNMNMEMALSTEQHQKISQSQIQWLKLLALDNFELKQMMEKEYLENPLLEHMEDGCIKAPSQGESFLKESLKPEIAAPSSSYLLEEAVTTQLPMDKYSKKEWEIILYLTRNLDDSGFFTGTVTETARVCQVSEEVVAHILTDLKKLEPYGIFAKSLKECLLLQLDAQGDKDPLKRQLIQEYLEELAQGRISVISRQLHVATARIRKCLGEISRLNPRPLNGFQTSAAAYVVPDIILSLNEAGNCFYARLNDDWNADYHISDYYYSMMKKTADTELFSYFETKYRRARLLVAGIEQRRETILSIADYIGKIQYLFLLGKGTKQPVTMTGAAKKLGIAVSTVSRAVKGKYIQYPAGNVFFKDLFEAGITCQEDESASSRAGIKEQLKILIENEDKHRPLSDIELSRELTKMQIHISRRTVAKYRDSMGIKGCFDRKCF